MRPWCAAFGEFGESDDVVANDDAAVAEVDAALALLPLLGCKAIMRPLMVRAASRAAIPLRSEPDDAAVGDVFGTLPVVVAVMRTLIQRDGKFFGDNLCHFHVETLAHLGAAVVHLH